MLLGVSDETECKENGQFEPVLSCIEEGDLSETQLRFLRREAKMLTAAAAAAVPLQGMSCVSFPSYLL